MLRLVRLEGNLLPNQLIILTGTRCNHTRTGYRGDGDGNDEKRGKIFAASENFGLLNDFEVNFCQLQSFVY